VTGQHHRLIRIRLEPGDHDVADSLAAQPRQRADGSLHGISYLLLGLGHGWDVNERAGELSGVRAEVEARLN
jgi:hypothetical protein